MYIFAVIKIHLGKLLKKCRSSNVNGEQDSTDRMCL